MHFAISSPRFALVLITSIVMAACGKSDPAGVSATATLSGVVRDDTGAFVEGASVSMGSITSTTGADGRFEFQNLIVGRALLVTRAPGFLTRTDTVDVIAGANVFDVVLTPTSPTSET